MKLSLMKRFFDTVEDKRSPLLDEIAGRWFGSSEALTYRASANFVARVAHWESTYFLRFNHESERSTGHIRAEMEYINRLIGRGINANVPVPSLSGKLIESVDTDLGVFHAVMFNEIAGVHKETDDLDISGFRLWGQALARVHEAGEDHEISGAPSWADHMDAVKVIATDNPVLCTEIRKLEKVLASYQQSGNYGLIPYDFEMDNIKWVGDSPGFMDFDDFCYHWHAADIAFALRDLFGDKMSEFDPNDSRFMSFIAGYREVKGIPGEELERIPVFIRLHNLCMYSRIHRALDGEVEKTDWVVTLRGKLRSKNESYLSDMAENPL